MVYTGFALSKLNKDDLIRITLDMKKNQNSILSDMKNELSVYLNQLLKKKNCRIMLESKCWSNKQYSRREGLKISGIPSDTEAGKLEETVLKVFEKLDNDVDPKNVECCHHWL